MSTRTPERAAALRPTARTEVVVAAVPGGRCRVRMWTSAPDGAASLRAMLLSSGPDHATVALVPEGAMLLAGDRIEVGCRVGAGVTLTVVEPAGTVAYDMRGGEPARWDVDLTVEDDATLVWQGLPFVAAAGSEVDRHTRVELAPSAALLLRETLVLGRSGEPAGTIRSRTRVTSRGRPVLVEDLELACATQVPGLLGQHRVLDSILEIGSPGAVAAPRALELAGGGRLHRELARETHESGLGQAWAAALTSYGPGRASARPRG